MGSSIMHVLRIAALVVLVAAGDAAAQQGASAPKPAAGCASPTARQFDFWIGVWNVTDPTGKVVGHNRVESILGGCALAEHWDGNGGVHGNSYNTYDASDRRWRQFWVDSQAGVLALEGGLVDGSMVLQSSRPGAHIDRIRWTPNADGSVRQLWEVSEDAGKTWATSFDGRYLRAP
ncbi:MAG: hypothetical protein ABI843_07595 [Dokdonella sp.]